MTLYYGCDLGLYRGIVILTKKMSESVSVGIHTMPAESVREILVKKTWSIYYKSVGARDKTAKEN